MLAIYVQNSAPIFFVYYDQKKNRKAQFFSKFSGFFPRALALLPAGCWAVGKVFHWFLVNDFFPAECNRELPGGDWWTRQGNVYIRRVWPCLGHLGVSASFEPKLPWLLTVISFFLPRLGSFLWAGTIDVLYSNLGSWLSSRCYWSSFYPLADAHKIESERGQTVH